MKTAVQTISSESQTQVLAIVSGRGCGREVVAAIPVSKTRSGWSVHYCGYERTWPKEWAALNDAKELAQRYIDVAISSTNDMRVS